MHSDIIAFKRHQYVYKEDDPSEYFYIVRSGEFKLLKELPILSDQDLMTRKIQQTEIPKFNSKPFKKRNIKEFNVKIVKILDIFFVIS